MKWNELTEEIVKQIRLDLYDWAYKAKYGLGDGLASPLQIKYIQNMNGNAPRGMTKIEASKTIKELIRKSMLDS